MKCTDVQKTDFTVYPSNSWGYLQLSRSVLIQIGFPFSQENRRQRCTNLGVLRWQVATWLPSRELTYPTTEKMKIIFKCALEGYMGFQEGKFPMFDHLNVISCNFHIFCTGEAWHGTFRIHPGKENHLPSTSILWFHVNLPGCIQKPISSLGFTPWVVGFTV